MGLCSPLLGKYIDEDLLMSMMQSNSADSVIQNAFSLIVATVEKTIGSLRRNFLCREYLASLKARASRSMALWS